MSIASHLHLIPQYQSTFSEASARRGRQVHARKAVFHLEINGYSIIGLVRGRKDIRCTITYHPQLNQWEDRCSCSLGHRCKHLFALSLAAQGRKQRAPRPTKEKSSPPPSSKPSPSPPQTDLLASVREFSRFLTVRMPPQLRARAQGFAHRLGEIWRRQIHAGSTRFTDWELRELGVHPNQNQPAYTHLSLPVIQNSPPRSIEDCFTLLKASLTAMGAALPAWLQNGVEAPALPDAPHPAVPDKAPAPTPTVSPPPEPPPPDPLVIAALNWQSRLKEEFLRTQSEPHLGSGSLRLRLNLGDQFLAIESAPDGESEYSPVGTSVLESLLNAKPSSLALEDPDTLKVLHLLRAIRYSGWHLVSNLIPRIDSSAQECIHSALRALHDTGRLVRDGKPLTFQPVPAVWSLAPDPKRPGWLVFGFSDPQGSPILPDLVLPGRPIYLLAGSSVWIGPASLQRLATDPSDRNLPEPALRLPSVLRALKKAGCLLPEGMPVQFTAVTPKPTFTLSIIRDFRTNPDRLLHLVLKASTDDGSCQFVLTGTSWTDCLDNRSLDLDPRQERTVPVPDLSLAQRAIPYLQSLGLSWRSTSPSGWVRHAWRDMPFDLSDWISSLPPEINLELEGELASLSDPPLEVTTQLLVTPVPGQRDWFDCELVASLDGVTLTESERQLLRSSSISVLNLSGKGWRRIVRPAPEAEGTVAEALGLLQSDSTSTTGRFHTIQLANANVLPALPPEVRHRVQHRARKVIRRARPELPPGLKAELRPYQVDGFHFLCSQSANGLGALLADDMGLGKTVQTLAWLEWLRHQPSRKRGFRALVICPKSVVFNWRREIERFLPDLTVSTLSPDSLSQDALSQVTIGNYAQLRLQEKRLARISWDAVILDEAQTIKNPATAVSKAARSLPCANRVALSGTPLENRLLDLWSIFEFIQPGLLGNMSRFRRTYGGSTRIDPIAANRLRARIRHFLLRRTKREVTPELPSRTEEEVRCDLEGRQLELYQAELKRARQIVLKVEDEDALRRDRFTVLECLLRLRQICCDPSLVGTGEVPPAESAKREALLQHLDELRAEGHKALVFSQFVGVLEILQQDFSRRNWPHLILTGATQNREALVQEFQESTEPSIFLISLKAGGFGLNLTAASYVFLYDPWWNPAVESQAIDRTHRIGQANPVMAYRLIARNTVEDKIRALQREKAALAQSVVTEDSLAQVLNLEDLKKVLGIDDSLPNSSPE